MTSLPKTTGSTAIVKLAGLMFFPALFSILPVASLTADSGPTDYLSPAGLDLLENGRQILLRAQTGKKLLIFDTASERVIREIPLPDEPTGVALSGDEQRIFVTTGMAQGDLLVLDARSGDLLRSIPVGHSPCAPVLSPEENLVFVCNRFENKVSVIDLRTGKLAASIPVSREPIAADLTPDGRFLYVSNHLPDGRADADYVASKLSVVDAKELVLAKNILLVNGAEGMRDVKVSPDGEYVYAAHLMARYQVPTSQIERGWINTNALSVVRVADHSLMYTVLLDDLDLGFANPWALAISADGKMLAVSSAGNHQVRIIDLPAMTRKIDEAVAAMNEGQDAMHLNAHNDLSFISDVSVRIDLKGKGPRAILMDGTTLYAAGYYSDSLDRLKLGRDFQVVDISSIPVGKQSAMTQERLGEFYFNDASLCFQKWQSCASCHSEDARTDGLNWDLLNDGIGNPKNVKSLLLSHSTPPAMISGIRDSAEVAVRAGIRYIQFAIRPEEDAVAIDQYLKSLRPVPSPRLINGGLSESALRGKKLFKAEGCAECHSGPYYTDMQSYDLGTGKGVDEGVPFDTPTLVEVWRTSPYMHDGSVVTIQELIRLHNPVRHWNGMEEMEEKDVADLAEFVNSL